MVQRSISRSIYCDSIQSHMNRVGTEIRTRRPSTPTSVIGFNQLLKAASPYSALSRPLILAHWAASLSSIRIVTPTLCRHQRRATNLSHHRPALQPDHNRLRRNAGISRSFPDPISSAKYNTSAILRQKITQKVASSLLPFFVSFVLRYPCCRTGATDPTSPSRWLDGGL